MSYVLEVEDLTVDYRRNGRTVRALHEVSLRVEEGKSLGVVGESGSGKSTLALALLGLLPATAQVSGSVRYRGTELVNANRAQLQKIRGRQIGLVYQDALVSMNPVRSVGSQVGESVRRGSPGSSSAEVNAAVVEGLRSMGIARPAEAAKRYPHEFSGGMRQRAAIAMALAANPEMLIADEVTTALDVTVQAQILQLLAKLRADRAMSMVIISHDLQVVSGNTDSVAVMYAGRIAEHGPTSNLLAAPRHPYTAGLIESAPSVDSPTISFIPGTPHSSGQDVVGCDFRDRCTLWQGRSICVDVKPPLAPTGDPVSDRSAACHFSDEVRLAATV